eukprot:255263_1
MSKKRAQETSNSGPPLKKRKISKKVSSKKPLAKTKKASKKKTNKQTADDKGNVIDVGCSAPHFESIPNEKNEKISLNDYKGKYLCLYFYPRDNTSGDSGCTSEGKRFRDLNKQFAELNCEIVGVSADKPETHQKFINKYDFNFSLLADTSRELIRKYGATKAGNRIQRS